MEEDHIEKDHIQIRFGQLFMEKCIPVGHNFWYSRTLSIKDEDYGEIKKCIEITAQTCLKYSQGALYKQIFDCVQRLMEGQDVETRKIFSNFLMSLPYEYQSKAKIKTIHKLELVNYLDSDRGQISKDEKFKPKLGELTVVQFWASWSGFCRTNIRQNLEILDKYQNVVYVAISLDESPEEHYQGMKQLLKFQFDPQKIIHYRFQDGWDHLNVDIRALKITKIPYILIIDEKQRIHHKGPPQDLIKHLNELTQNQSIYFYDIQAKYIKNQTLEQLEQEKQETMSLQDNHEQMNKPSSKIQSEINFQSQQARRFEKNDFKNTDHISQIKQSLINEENQAIPQDESDSEDELYDNKHRNSETLKGLDLSELLEIKDDSVYDLTLQFFKLHLPTLINTTITSKGMETQLRVKFLYCKTIDEQDNGYVTIERSKIDIKHQLPQKQQENMNLLEDRIKQELQQQYKAALEYDKIISIAGSFIDDEKQIYDKIMELFDIKTTFKDNFIDSINKVIYHRYGNTHSSTDDNGIIAKQNPEIQQVIECKKEFDKFIQDFDESSQYNGQRLFQKLHTACYLKPGMDFQEFQEYENDESLTKIGINQNFYTLIYYFNKDQAGYLEDIIYLNKQQPINKQYQIHAINLDSKQDKEEENDLIINDSLTTLYTKKTKEQNPYQFDIMAYGQIECPYYIVVNKEGIILRNESVTSDYQYHELFAGQDDMIQLPKKEKINYLKADPEQQIKNIMKDARFNNYLKFCMECSIMKFESMQTKKAEFSAQVQYRICKSLEQELHLKLKNIDENIQILQDRCKIIDDYQIKNFEQVNKLCMNCSQNIPQDQPQYYSRSKEKYICCLCVEQGPVENQGGKIQWSQNIVIYIHAPFQNPSILRYMEEDEADSAIYEQISYCIRCGNMNGVYKCISCLHEQQLWLCSECFKILRDKSSKYYSEMIEGLRNYTTGDIVFQINLRKQLQK